MNLELLGRIDPAGSSTVFNYNDVWGYAADGREYAIVGAADGVYFFDVTDPAAPTQIEHLNGFRSLHRDIKTHSHYAYITHDAGPASAIPTGLYIVDLSGLPQSVELVTIYDEVIPRGTAHNLYIDNGIAYIAGGRESRQLIMLDLSNPESPVMLKLLNETYWHDVIVNDDLIFGSALDSGIDIYRLLENGDVTPISQTSYPDAFTHNIWPTPDNEYMIVTDERFGLPLRFWDISDPAAPQQVAQYDLASNMVPHNAHIMGDYAYVSFYYDGLKIFDIRNRHAPTQVAYYDTFAGYEWNYSVPFDGAWGVYPNLPSGNILVSDMTNGLYILRFNETRAGSIGGIISEENSGALLAGVKIEVLNSEDNLNDQPAFSNGDGSYAVGRIEGRADVRFTKFGYESLLLEDVAFDADNPSVADIELHKLPTAAIILRTQDQAGHSIPGLTVSLREDELQFYEQIKTDVNGSAEQALVYGNYLASVYSWGYVVENVEFTIDSPELQEIVITLDVGYAEVFEEQSTWSLNTNSETPLTWDLTAAAEQEFGEQLPLFDADGKGKGTIAVAAAVLNSVTLTSAPFDASSMQAAFLRFSRWYTAPFYEQTNNADDSLQVWISDGVQWHMIAAFTDVQDEAWETIELNFPPSLELTDNMKLRFKLVEGDRDNLVGSFRQPCWAALDKILIYGPPLPTSIDTDIPQDLNKVDNLFSVHPNPVKSILNIVPSLDGLPPTARVRITNVLGQAQLERLLQLMPGVEGLQLNISDLAGGVYFVTIELGDERTQTLQIQVGD